MRKNTVFLILGFILSQALYWVDLQPQILKLAVIYTVQFPLCFYIFYKAKGEPIVFRWVLLATVVTRLIVWTSTPLLEDDFHRYLWDGRVIANGINPYEYAPNQEQLDHLHTDYREKINYLHIRTIYPPLAQFLFWWNHQLFPDSLIGLKFWFLLFDLGTLIVLWRWITFRNADPRLILLYAFSPLAIKEMANSAHLDAMAMFFLALAFYWSEKALKNGNWKRAWVALSLSLATKLFGFLLLPIFFLKDKKRFQNLALAMIVFCGLYLPFLGAGRNLFGGLSAFGKYWTFNESLFAVFNFISKKIIVALPIYETSIWLKTAIINAYPARLISVGALGIFALTRIRPILKSKNLGYEAMILLGALYIVSPVVNSWYLLWILPFVVLEKNWPWLVFTLLCGGSYSFFHERSWLVPWQWVEYSIFYAILGYWIFIQRKKMAEIEPLP